MAKWIEGKVVRLRQWTSELYSVQVEADIAPFTAGQFNRLALEIDGEMVARPYSFVNGPDNPLHEFYFITVKDGPLTAELIKLQTGDSLYLAPKAAGFFILNEVPDAETLWMLSTGTAIGPFLSILSTDEVISGRVPYAIEDGRLEERAGLKLTPENSQVMICGNPAMVRDTQGVLEARGLKKNRRRDPGHITTEQYWKD
jgi:ferredoxin--NADP+ reductase